MRTVGVEEELLVVDREGRPVPLGPAALRIAARRGHGETVEEHEATDRADPQLVPELRRSRSSSAPRSADLSTR
jgi:carboxylate-amine ligase